MPPADKGQCPRGGGTHLDAVVVHGRSKAFLRGEVAATRDLHRQAQELEDSPGVGNDIVAPGPRAAGLLGGMSCDGGV